MRRIHRLLLFAVVVALTLVLIPSVARAAKTPAPNEVGVKAYSYVEQLAAATRVAGTPGEKTAAARISGWFTDAGYSPTMQPFSLSTSNPRAASLHRTFPSSCPSIRNPSVMRMSPAISTPAAIRLESRVTSIGVRDLRRNIELTPCNDLETTDYCVAR